MICVLLIIYLAFSLFFIHHYYFGTTIGDISCGGKTPEKVEALIKERAENYVLKVEGREGTEAALSASEIGLQFLLDDELNKIANVQNGFLWISFLWNHKEYDMPVTVSYEEALLDDRLQSMLLFQDGKMREPVNAYIGEYSSENGAYQIIPEDKGTLVDKQKVKAAVIHAIEEMEEVLDLEAADCYVKPDIGQDDELLVRFCARLNRFVSSRIVYDWHGIEEIVDGDLIHQWLDIDRENLFVSINSQAVRDYVDSLSKKNDTFGTTRSFRTSEGKDILLKPGTYGWRVDRAKETEKLIKLIRSGWKGDREPEYLYTAAVKGEDDIGDSYVEINLSAQHLYLYVEGELITESDFVSGNVARGFTTPEGVYGLTYKTLNATLKGQGYATPVDYWMPFNGNIGMHDASWRREFGGDIYLRNGSHGCINLPSAEAEKIYGYVYKGFPVICYEDNSMDKNMGGNSDKKTDAVVQTAEETKENMENGADENIGNTGGDAAGGDTGAGTEYGLEESIENDPGSSAYETITEVNDNSLDESESGQ